MRYLCYGYKFGIEKDANGLWWAVGHAKGKHPYKLDKVGFSEDQEKMQGKLDAWAKRVGATKAAEHEAPAAGWQDKGGQLELFKNMQHVPC